MLSCVVINRPHSRRTRPSVFPYPIPILELTPPSSHKRLALSFHALTKCKFRIPFVLIFIQNARGGYPLQSLDPLSRYPLSFRKLYFQHSRTYLQEPAQRRPGGIQSCPTVVAVSSLGPHAPPSPEVYRCCSPHLSFRRSAPWRNPRPPRQAPLNQRLPRPRTAGSTFASSVPTPRVRLYASMSPSNSPKKFSPPSTRTACTPARSKLTTPIWTTSTSAPSLKLFAPPRTANSSLSRVTIATFASPSRATTSSFT